MIIIKAEKNIQNTFEEMTITVMALCQIGIDKGILLNK